MSNNTHPTDGTPVKETAKPVLDDTSSIKPETDNGQEEKASPEPENPATHSEAGPMDSERTPAETTDKEQPQADYPGGKVY